MPECCEFPSAGFNQSGCPYAPRTQILLALSSRSQSAFNKRWHGPSPCSVPNTSDPEEATAHPLSSAAPGGVPGKGGGTGAMRRDARPTFTKSGEVPKGRWGEWGRILPLTG